MSEDSIWFSVRPSTRRNPWWWSRWTRFVFRESVSTIRWSPRDFPKNVLTFHFVVDILRLRDPSKQYFAQREVSYAGYEDVEKNREMSRLRIPGWRDVVISSTNCQWTYTFHDIVHWRFIRIFILPGKSDFRTWSTFIPFLVDTRRWNTSRTSWTTSEWQGEFMPDCSSKLVVPIHASDNGLRIFIRFKGSEKFRFEKNKIENNLIYCVEIFSAQMYKNQWSSWFSNQIDESSSRRIV